MRQEKVLSDEVLDALPRWAVAAVDKKGAGVLIGFETAEEARAAFKKYSRAKKMAKCILIEHDEAKGLFRMVEKL